jgi:hypothetical protein
MARKRKPLVVNGVTVELDAPGLTIIERSNGEVHQYWRVSEEGRARGYLPRTVRLYYDLATMAGRLDLERRCKLLTNEMLTWLRDPEGQKKPVYDGTMAALIRCYQQTRTRPITVCVRVRLASTAIGAEPSSARLVGGVSTA